VRPRMLRIQSKRRLPAWVPALAMIVAGGGQGLGCKKSAPPAPKRELLQALPKLEVSKDSPLLYTYVEPKGTFATTDKADDVPQNARHLVRVVDPAKAADMEKSTQVYVVDLGELLGAGKAVAKGLSREAFETGALAQLPPGESSPLSGPHGPALPDVSLGGMDGGVAGPLGPPVVILYGTPWCGACKSAKQYLAAKHIPYAYKDIENDPAAARELQAKASKMGIPADRVPVLDVRGRLLLGFDRARLDAMLGDAT
jgi:glutaredoxin 3